MGKMRLKAALEVCFSVFLISPGVLSLNNLGRFHGVRNNN